MAHARSTSCAEIRPRPRRRLPRLIEHRPQHVRHLRQLRFDDLEPLPHPGLRVWILPDHLDVARHQIERRADLMRDAGGHLPHRGEALGARESFLQAEHALIALLELGVADEQLRCRLAHALLQHVAGVFKAAEHVVETISNHAKLVAPQHRARAMSDHLPRHA